MKEDDEFTLDDGLEILNEKAALDKAVWAPASAVAAVVGLAAADSFDAALMATGIEPNLNFSPGVLNTPLRSPDELATVAPDLAEAAAGSGAPEPNKDGRASAGPDKP